MKLKILPFTEIIPFFINSSQLLLLWPMIKICFMCKLMNTQCMIKFVSYFIFIQIKIKLILRIYFLCCKESIYHDAWTFHFCCCLKLSYIWDLKRWQFHVFFFLFSLDTCNLCYVAIKCLWLLWTAPPLILNTISEKAHSKSNMFHTPLEELGEGVHYLMFLLIRIYSSRFT